MSSCTSSWPKRSGSQPPTSLLSESLPSENAPAPENPDVIEGFSKAINKALKYVKEKDSTTIAENIANYFPDTSLNDLITIVEEYKNGDAWKENISINEDEWQHIQNIIISAGELDSYAPYQDLIYTKYFDDFE